jgi:hypothetical protein
MIAGRRSKLKIVALNAAGIAAFLFLGSRLWVDRRVTEVPGPQLGRYFTWEMVSSTMFLAAVGVGLTGLVLAMRKSGWATRAKAGLFVAVVTGCWLAAIWFDAAHRVID